ncbi:MAG TPA: hypothetical protein VLN45_02120 [Ignavibacteriaceae bacterium]|nr:hypothetical protein [Ignavibacteriaceae bacterium]
MKTSGYSGTPLVKKLGIKENFKIKIINQPDYYFELFLDSPFKINPTPDNKIKKDFIHFFTTEKFELLKNLPKLKKEIELNGMIWISWPKKASNIKTDITEDVIREVAIKNGLVDVKVCAVDEIWSGLKLVIPLKDR